MSITRIFRRRAEVLGRPAPNEATGMMENPLLKADTMDAPNPVDVRAQFIARWPIIKKSLEHHRHLGVLILAFDESKTAIGQAWLKASLDKTRAAIIGRHSMCSLAMPQDYQEISLRHLAVLIRAIDHEQVRIRVFDLNTSTGFRDEDNRVLQAVVSEGPTFLRLGRTLLMVLVTDEASPIPDDAEAAYSMIPPRVFVEERRGTAGVKDRRPSTPGRIAPGATLIRSKPGPLVAAGDLVQSDEMALGSLLVRTGGSAVRRPVGASSLDRGILIGRYARCDVGATFDEDSRLSRVHFLITREGNDVIGIDTASTNGSFKDKKSILLERLSEGEIFDLAGEIDIAWHEA
jgi:hypothetical protein